MIDISIAVRRINLSKDSRKKFRARALKVLSRYEHRITSAKLTFTDINGQKGGIDKVCTMQARLVHGGEIVVTKKADHLLMAFSRSLQSIRHSIARLSDRQRRQRNHLIGHKFEVIL